MIHYTCDICGRKMDGRYHRPARRAGLAQLCNAEDICPDCAKAGETIDVAGVLLNAWKLIIHPADPQESEVLREHDRPPSVSTLGRCSKEKQKILEHLTQYRETNGLGCLAAVAKLAGPAVSDCLLRDILIGAASPPIEVWRRIGKVLDKLEGRNE